jgi:hypothetical protein
MVTPRPADDGPRADYGRRLADLRAVESRLEKRLAWCGNVRFGLLLASPVFIVILAQFRWISPLWLALPVVAFVALSVGFGRAAGQLAVTRRAAAYYDIGLARLEDRWAGHGVPGDEYRDDAHPCAADLDLFGRGSLFELLCTARTRAGRDALARWLLDPAPPDEVRARQEAVRDLAGRPAWRVRLALAADDVPAGLNTTALAAWGREGAAPPAPVARRVAPFIVVLTLATLASWAVSLLPVSATALAVLVQSGFAVALGPRVRRALDGLRGRSRDLAHFAGLLACVEREAFEAARLKSLQNALVADGEPPSLRLRELAQLIAQIDATKNQFFGLIAPFLLWTTRAALAAEDWRRAAGPALGRWVEVIGEA